MRTREYTAQADTVLKRGWGEGVQRGEEREPRKRNENYVLLSLNYAGRKILLPPSLSLL